MNDLSINTWQALNVKTVPTGQVASKASALQACDRLCEEAFNYRFNLIIKGLPQEHAKIEANSWIEADAPTTDSVSDLIFRDRRGRVGSKKSSSNRAVAIALSGFTKY